MPISDYIAQRNPPRGTLSRIMEDAARRQRYAQMTHTGQEPVGMDTVRAAQAIPGNIASWARENPVDAALMAGSMAPVVGDVLGLAADAKNMYENPEERTLVNAMLAGAGALPFVPSGLGMVKRVGGGPKISKNLYEDAFKTSNKRRGWPKDRSEDALALRQEIASVRAQRRDARRMGSDHLLGNDAELDPLILAARKRPYQAEKLRNARPYLDLGGDLWNAKFRNEVAKWGGATDLWGESYVRDAINKANLEAVPRLLKKEGWKMRHGSKGRDGRKSSRYLVSPDGKYEVRLSDHELPDTPQRQYMREQTGGPRWSDEIVLMGDESPSEVIDAIKRSWAGEE